MSQGIARAVSLLIFLAAFSVIGAPNDAALTWRDLINHPERWPDTTKVTGTLNFGKDVVKHELADAKHIAKCTVKAATKTPCI